MATKTTSVALTEHFVGFTERLIREGPYGSTFEGIRAGR